MLKLEMKLQLFCYHENSNIFHSLLKLLTQVAYIFLVHYYLSRVVQALAVPTLASINHISSELLPAWREPPPFLASHYN